MDQVFSQVQQHEFTCVSTKGPEQLASPLCFCCCFLNHILVGCFAVVLLNNKSMNKSNSVTRCAGIKYVKAVLVDRGCNKKKESVRLNVKKHLHPPVSLTMKYIFNLQLS